MQDPTKTSSVQLACVTLRPASSQGTPDCEVPPLQSGADPNKSYNHLLPLMHLLGHSLTMEASHLKYYSKETHAYALDTQIRNKCARQEREI